MARVHDAAQDYVPARSLHVKAVHVGALTWRLTGRNERELGTQQRETVWAGSDGQGSPEVVSAFLSDVTLQAHLVQRPLVLPRHALHDGREERLGVEKAGQPHRPGHLREKRTSCYQQRGDAAESPREARAYNEVLRPVL